MVILSIGLRLKEARKARGMSQELLAEKIGASRGVVTNIEHDKVLEHQPLVVNDICDVLKINRQWLLRAGLLPERIEVSGICTACRPDLFWSHRKMGDQRGVQVAVISLKEGL